MRSILFILAVFSMALFSCQPDTDEIIPPQETNDSIYISRVVEIDTLFASGLDTSQNTIYKYDASGRLSHVWFGEYFRGVAGADLTDDYCFFYNGTDTLPHKVVHLSGSRNSLPVINLFRYDTGYFFYNSAGQVIKDSIVSSNRNQLHEKTSVSVYTKIKDGHYRIDEKVITTTETLTGYTNSHFVKVNGNHVSSRDTIFSPYPGNDAVSAETASYDNHPNPLFRTTIPYPTSSSYNAVLGESSFNNLTRWEGTYDYGGGPGRHYLEIYEYKYRADGYPVIRFSKDELEPSIKRLYIYTKL